MLGFLDFRIKAKEVSWHLLAMVGLLLAFGLIFVWSATENMPRMGNGLGKQMVRILLSTPFLLAGLFVSPRWLRRNAYLIYGITILLLIGLFFFGGVRNNARRWFTLFGSFSIQPSEFLKIGLILALAKLMMYRRRLGRIEGLVLPLALLGLPLALIAMQPDLGTALVLIPVTLSIMFAAGVNKKHLAMICLAGIVAIPVGYSFLKPYQRTRIDTWLQQNQLDTKQKQNEAYHLWTSKVSIGSGGFFGHGIAQGPQNQLDRLPERHNDYIVALVGEEGGFFTTGALLAAYLLLVGLIFGVALRLREPFGRLVVVGIAALFGTQVLVNFGVATALLPPTGLTLPLVSYGGSSMLAAFLALGLVLNFGARREYVFGLEGFGQDDTI